MPDDEIEPVTRSLRWQKRHCVVHCSGATEVSALAAADEGDRAALEANGPVRGLAGPIARADIGTVERHLEAIRAHAPVLLPAYLDLARRSLPIAEAKGGARKDKIDALRALLERLA